MTRLSAIAGAGIIALLVFGDGGAALCQTRAQQLAAWNQAIMLRRIDQARKAEEAEIARRIEQLQPAEPVVPMPPLRQTRSRARWLALERAAGRQ